MACLACSDEHPCDYCVIAGNDKPMTDTDKPDAGESRKPIMHELKTWPDYFGAVQRGDKKFELRKNDRDFRVGDKLLLLEWEPDVQRYTGNKVEVAVTYIAQGVFGLPDDMCVMSIELSAREWRRVESVKDLPKEDGRYLVTLDYTPHVQIRYFFTESRSWVPNDGIVAWKELDEPYTEEERS